MLLQRCGDRVLMQAFFEATPTQDEFKALNRCRLFIKAYFLSDIVTGDGIAITEEVWMGINCANRIRQVSWPNQGNPPRTDWQIWRSFLKKCFIFRGRRLKQCLSPWIEASDDWEWYFSPKSDKIYKRCENKWLEFPSIIQRKHLPAFTAKGQSSEPPSDLCKATMYKNKDKIVGTGYGTFFRDHYPSTQSFSDLLSKADNSEK